MADKFSNVSTVMTLTAPALAVDGTINVNDASGLPLTFPYRLAIAYETSDVEIVLCTSAAGNTLTVTRGQEDTPARPHSIGQIVVHVWTAKHATDTTAHIEQTQNVHGIGSGSSAVGTDTAQTLTNKTISGSNNTITNISSGAIASLDGSKITGVITTATIAVANVTGNWPIDTRSTGSIDIATRTSGSLPIDTRTSGNLPGSRLASPVTAAMTFNSGVTVNQPASGAGATFVPTTTPTASTVIVTGNEAMPGLTVRRNNASSLTNALVYIAKEDGTALLQIFRNGKLVSTESVEATDVLISDSPDRSLDKPPILRLRRTAAQSVAPGAVVPILFNQVDQNRGGFTYNAGSGQITVPYEGLYETTMYINVAIEHNGAVFINRPSNASFDFIGGSPGQSGHDTVVNASITESYAAGQNIFGRLYQFFVASARNLNSAQMIVKYAGPAT